MSTDRNTLTMEGEGHPSKERRMFIALVITVLSWMILPQGLIFFFDLVSDSVILLTLQYVFVLIPLVVYALVQKDVLAFLGFRDKINLKILFYGLILPLVLLFSAFSVVTTYVTFFGIPEIPDTGVSLDPGGSFTELFRIILFIMVINAPAEEIFFRRYLQRVLVETSGFGVGLIVTSAIFGVLHYLTSPLTAINAFFLGIILGVAYHKTESMYTTWIGHGIYNSFLIYIAFLFSPF